MPLEADLPCGLCSDCSGAVHAAANFRYLCHRSVGQWNVMVKLLNELPTINISKLESIFAVIENNKIYILENEIKYSHSKTRHDNTKIEYKDEIKLVKERRKRRSFSVSNIKKSCSCPDCGKLLNGPNELYEHFLESTDNKKACYVCASIMTREELIVHIKEKHRKNLFGCKKCRGLFQTASQFREHTYKAHSPGAIYCGDCGSTFQTQQAFNGHCVKHLAKTCPGCNKLFRNRKCYLYHVICCCNLDKNRQDTHRTKHKVSFEVKNNERRVKVGMRGSADETCICDYCNKPFSGKKYVRAHIQIVHTKNTHRPCPYCGKFLAAAHMTEHIKKHEQTRSYTCEHCGIVLNTRLGYIQHIRLHTGEKPYVCKLCHEAFSASSRRSEHIRKKHKKAEELVLKHVCEFCPARFRLPYRLKKHIETVHGEKPDGKRQDFECPECHIKFSSCRGLLYHTRKHQATSLRAVKEERDDDMEDEN